MDTVKLMDGLEIKFGDDGTWLSFSTSSGSGSTVRLESLASQAGIVGVNIGTWCKEARTKRNAVERKPEETR